MEKKIFFKAGSFNLFFILKEKINKNSRFLTFKTTFQFHKNQLTDWQD